MNKLVKKAGTTAFSTLTWSTAVPWMIFNASTTFAASPLIPLKKSQCYWMQPGMGLCVRLAGVKLRKIYHPDFDPARRSVFCQNHVSILDGHLACATIPHQFCGIMNHWHFNVPGYGWIMKLAKGIPVYPRKSGRTSEMTDAARQRVEEGISILAFPEAHRTLDGQIREFKRGIFFMARDAGIPVVPLAIRGMFEVNRKGSPAFHPGREVCAFFGPQFETEGLSDDEITVLSQEVRQMMVDWVEHEQLPPDCPEDKQVVPVWPIPTHWWQSHGEG